jgi:hypothetical protein
MELLLKDREKRLYTKLFISRRDVCYARECARFIRKKGWHCQPMERRGSIYFQQSAFTTALVVAYARVFKESRRLANFPECLRAYNEVENKLHERLMTLRDQVYAHSDGTSYSIRPWRSGSFSTDIVSAPVLMLTTEEMDTFLEMTERVLVAIEARMKELLADAS